MKALFIFSIALFSNTLFAVDKLMIAEFSSKNLTDWEEKEFKGMTIYNFVKEGDKNALKAVADNSASGMFKKQTVDITKYPYLNWTWKTTQKSGIDNERVKKGDDYTARIYVIVDGGFFFWKTKALNYVWSNSETIGTVWPNAFAPDNAMMLAVRSKTDSINVWHQEKRNLLADFKKAFGEDFDHVDGIAIMADTDNAGGVTTSYFGDMYFTEN